MIIIEFDNIEFSFSSKFLKWKSEDKELEKMFNNNLPLDLMGADTPFKEGPMGTIGIDGLFLERAIDIVGSDEINIIRYEPEPIPKEEEGLVY